MAQAAKAQSGVHKMRAGRPIRKDGIALLMIALPFVAFIFVFNYIPLFGWVYAFFDYKPGIPLADSPFVGLDYFRQILEDRDIVRVLCNTLAMSFLGILVSPLPALFAILLSELKSSAFKRFIQTTTTLPHFISWVIVFSLAFSLFSTDGLVNRLLQQFGLGTEPLNVLGNASITWYFQTALGIWKGLGWGAIIYLAAISGIDSELYDAASIDGAGRYRKIWHITVPGLMPAYIVLLLLSIGNLLSLGLDQYLVFYNSRVADKIEVLDYYTYRLGILTNDYSYGTAVGIAKSLIGIALLFTANGISKLVRGTGIV